jgi:hypothetical protein
MCSYKERIEVSENRVPRRIFRPKKDEEARGEKNYIMRIFSFYSSNNIKVDKKLTE